MTLKNLILLTILLSEVLFLAYLFFKPHETTKKAPTIALCGKSIKDPRFIVLPAYRAWVMESAAEFAIPRDIACRLAYEESGWDENAVNWNANGTFDQGLYQLNSAFHPPMATRQNIREGLRYLRACWEQTGRWELAVRSYNAGIWGARTPTMKTVAFARRVIRGVL